MLRRTLICLGMLAVLAGGFAQSEPPPSFDTRLGIVENRLGRLEVDVSRLNTVPTSLARIETKLENLAEKSTGQGAVLQTVGLGIVMSVITGGIGFLQGRKAQTPK